MLNRKTRKEGMEPSSFVNASPIKSSDSWFARLRKRMVHMVAEGTPFLLNLQKHGRNPLFHIWLRGSSALGDQWSYMVILPMCFWTGDVLLGAEFTLCLLIGTFLGNFAKNVFALPRPPSPPVALLQHTMRDFGFPSVHTLNAVTVSGVLLRYHYVHGWFYFTKDANTAIWLFLASVGIAVLWCVSIPLSRMYVGVHSPLDVVAGFTSGIAFIIVWLWTYPHLYHWITVTRTLMVPIVCVAAFLAVTIHPRSQRPSPSYRNNIAVIGIIVGTFIGLAYTVETKTWLSGLGLPWPKVSVESIQSAIGLGMRSQAVSVARFGTGIVIVLLVKIIMEPLLTLLFTILFVLPVFSTVKRALISVLSTLILPHPEALNNVDHPSERFEREIEENMRETELDKKSERRLARREAGVLSRVVTHALLGVCIVSIVPAIFSLCGLSY